MKSIKDLCSPRKSTFDQSRRDVVLDIMDLIENKIVPETFFAENYVTHGMKDLLVSGARRLAGKSDQSTFVLSQAMGGGKTHNMITLGLLAKHPEFRKEVLPDTQHTNLGAARVIGFTGRESDAPLGIWGSLAEQLGKKDLFKDYYSPLQAPGTTAWINLLKGEPLLILLDELPPYFNAAKSKSIGNSDLSEVSGTALANLLTAVSKEELSNVCVVIADLKATYGEGSAQLNKALDNFQNEVGRSAMTLEPVGLNTNELYHILRTRIFETLPARTDIEQTAQAYSQAVKDAKQMDITHASPEEFAKQLTDSYPFHFSIKDLYARFRENPGFQQTRGLIRLMRVLVARLWESGQAGNLGLIHPYDIDLNDEATKSEIRAINAKLENAISHDIASGGVSVAENLDKNRPGNSSDAQDAAKLLLVSSLANVPGATLGLNASEVVSYLCRPGRDVSRLLKDVLGVLKTKAWYLHANREGKLFFKNTENLIAKVHTTAESYSREVSVKELRAFLESTFEPKLKHCYQEVAALTAIDEIKLAADKVTLLISEPSPASGGLSDDLRDFWEDTPFKNRIAFLTGDRLTMSTLVENAAELKAVASVLEEMAAEKIPDSDPQFVSAQEMHDAIRLRLLSAARESFTRLHYPGGDNALLIADFLMNFSDNNYNGEKQIQEALAGKQKFTEDIDSSTFRKKCEQRLFTQQVMPYAEIKKRAAMNPKWQWHHASALDNLKNRMILEDQWREDGGYIDKGPFPAPSTEVRVQVLRQDEDTGVATLRITPVHGDIVHYEIGSSPVTTASAKVDDLQAFDTSELRLSFLAVDSSGAHETGKPSQWTNKIILKSRTFQQGDDKMCELQSAPKIPILYTTDGSDPRTSGGTYDAPFLVPQGTVCILAVAQKNQVSSEVQRIDIDWSKKEGVSVDPSLPVLWKRSHKLSSTQETYQFLGLLKKFGASAPGCGLTVGEKRWIDVKTEASVALSTEHLESILECVRGILGEGQVELHAPKLRFPTGQHLLDWVADVHTEIKPGELEQQPSDTDDHGNH